MQKILPLPSHSQEKNPTRSETRHHSILLPVLLMLLLGPQLYGQSDSTLRPNSVSGGSWALQFSVSSYFTLSSFQGSILSVQYHLSATRALRVGVSGELSMYRSQLFDTDLMTVDRQSFKVITAYLFYSHPHSDIFLFWGAGPTVGLDRTYEKRPGPAVPDYDITTTTEYPLWSAGLTAVVGVEWFATGWLSFHAEYGVSAAYSWETIKESTDHVSVSPGFPSYSSEYEIVVKKWNVSPTGAWFGASIYP